MKSFKTKLALSALAVAMLATPALAQRQHHSAPATSQVQQPVEHYPNGGAGRTGTEQSYESGNEFNLGD